MIARAEHDRIEANATGLLAIGFSEGHKLHITVGVEYEVFAVSVWRGVAFFQILEDGHRVEDGDPVGWLPSQLFTVIEPSMPDDWICMSFTGGVQLVIGPPFVAESESAYAEMVESEPHRLKLFYERLAARSSASRSEE